MQLHELLTSYDDMRAAKKDVPEVLTIDVPATLEALKTPYVDANLTDLLRSPEWTLKIYLSLIATSMPPEAIQLLTKLDGQTFRKAILGLPANAPLWRQLDFGTCFIAWMPFASAVISGLLEKSPEHKAMVERVLPRCLMQMSTRPVEGIIPHLRFFQGYEGFLGCRILDWDFAHKLLTKTIVTMPVKLFHMILNAQQARISELKTDEYDSWYQALMVANKPDSRLRVNALRAKIAPAAPAPAPGPAPVNLMVNVNNHPAPAPAAVSAPKRAAPQDDAGPPPKYQKTANPPGNVMPCEASQKMYDAILDPTLTTVPDETWNRIERKDYRPYPLQWILLIRKVASLGAVSQTRFVKFWLKSASIMTYDYLQSHTLELYRLLMLIVRAQLGSCKDIVLAYKLNEITDCTSKCKYWKIIHQIAAGEID